MNCCWQEEGEIWCQKKRKCTPQGGIFSVLLFINPSLQFLWKCKVLLRVVYVPVQLYKPVFSCVWRRVTRLMCMLIKAPAEGRIKICSRGWIVFKRWAPGCLWEEMKRCLKYGNASGWLGANPGAGCACSRWLFCSLITDWSGEISGSFLGWNKNLLWNARRIGTARVDTKKPVIKMRHSAQNAFFFTATCQKMPR